MFKLNCANITIHTDWAEDTALILIAHEWLTTSKVVTGIDRWAADNEFVRLCRATVVAQRSKN